MTNDKNNRKEKIMNEMFIKVESVKITITIKIRHGSNTSVKDIFCFIRVPKLSFYVL